MAAKKTLLDIVQRILVDLNGDAVNSIGDTEEAEEVASHVRSVYLNLVSHTEWPHTRRAVTLIPFSDNAHPTHMSVAEDYKRLCFINYNRAKLGEDRKMYKPVQYLDPDKFLMKTNSRDNTSDRVDIILDTSGIELLISNDKHPEWYTSFNDIELVFDSYDKEVDDTLQESKVQAQAYIIPQFTIADTFVPDLPPDAFAYLIEESISRCQLKMRQFQDIKSEAEAQKQSRWLSQSNFVVKGGIKFPDWGYKR